MEAEYAETLNSFATDLDNIWKDKNKYRLQNQRTGKEEGNCTLKRFMLSAAATNIGTKKSEYLSNTQRLNKTSSIWIQPDFSRNDVDRILLQFEIGIFIVRVNSDKKTMVLSYRTEDRVQHVRIKVDLRKGFYMDGSQNIFKNVNEMISHYMTHSIQSPDLLLRLPRALREASDSTHFKFFENLKGDFWKTSLPNKSITDIFIKSTGPASKSSLESADYNQINDYESTPPLPPREYDINDLSYIQGLADEENPESYVYNEIEKGTEKIPKSKPYKSFPNTLNDRLPDHRVYSPIWQCETGSKDDSKTVEQEDIEYSVIDKKIETRISNFENRKSIPSEISTCDSVQTITTTLSEDNAENKSTKKPAWESKETLNSQFSESLNVSTKTNFTTLSPNSINNRNSIISNKRNSFSSASKDVYVISDIIKYYYPQLIYIKYVATGEFASRPSLTQDIIKGKNMEIKQECKVDIQSSQSDHSDTYSCEECEYDIPWELKNPLISKYIDIENYEGEKQSEYMYKIVKSDSNVEKSKSSQMPVTNLKGSNDSVNMRNPADKDQCSMASSKKSSVISYTDDESDDDEKEQLQHELLAEIQPVIFSSNSYSPIYNVGKPKYGQLIRKYLIQLCSRRGHSDISTSVRTFIQCTMDRTDLSPYTTMRLMRQYMSGLKNMIKQQKSEYSLLAIIEEERKITPRNVFINFDSIIESVLTKSVVKPLSSYVYRLLILEHYKNNNLNLISEGVEEAKKLEPKKLGLKDDSISIIKSKIPLIENKFDTMAKQYAPEKKIAQIISIIEIIFQIVKQINPEIRSDSMRNDFKSDYLLPILVYIFSQCKTEAVATQCEVEYIEGLIWSSTLVDGEPGFYLMNIMSSLEAIKVLARPKIDRDNFMDLRNNKSTKIDNSTFSKSINPSTISEAAIGSVGVIILDEKLNRLVTKTFPVRSTVTVGNLCNSISHRLGIFNPKEYSLYRFTGSEDILLNENEYPLSIKQAYQQKTGETVNFLFKRKNAIFILPSFIPMK